MRALSNVFVVILFCAAIFAPAAAYLEGVQPQQIENRPLRELPQIGAATFEQLTGFLQDHLPLRAQAIQLQTWVGLTVFGDSPSKEVLVGRDGWLFYAADYRNVCSFAPHFDEMFAGISRFNDLLAAHGKTFILAVVPDKTDIYSDYASLTMQLRTGAGCVSDRRASLRDIGLSSLPTVMLDLWTPLEEARGTTPEAIYHALDTHWTDRGMIVGSQTVVDRLRRGLWSADDVVDIGLNPQIGDLSLLLGLPQREATRRLQVRRASTWLKRVELKTRDGRGYDAYQSIGSAPRLPKAVLLTDSFFELSIEVLPPYFDTLTYVPMVLRDSDALTCSIASSQIVIFSVAERSVYDEFWKLNDTRTRLESLLAEGPNPPSCPQPSAS